MKRILGLMIVALLAPSACGDDSTVVGDESGDEPSVVGEWVLVEGPVPDAAIGTTTLEVADDGGIRGSTACNSYGVEGPAIDGNRWVARGFFSTAMGCEPERMDAERAYLDLLAEMDRIAVTATSLELSDSVAGNVLRFERVLPAADSDLAGTVWVLDSLILGDAVSSTMSGSADATLLLDEQGSVSGSDGCGELVGTYEVVGDSITMEVTTDVGTTCDERFAEQAAHIEQVLGSDLRFTIEGPRLTLLAPDGLGLDYRTAE